jgi:hypothetical protein
MSDICAALLASPFDDEGSDVAYGDELRSVKDRNLLYMRGPEGFVDVTDEWGASLPAWTWNARFADLDNDGWQDLYLAQGTRLRPNSSSAIYYRNERGDGFTDATSSSGLEDHNPTGASLSLDFDLDGDLDVLTSPFLLTPVLWRNDAPTGRGFEIALEDRRSDNRLGVGARIEIRASDGRVQAREIKASGGYISHDAPVARFGLGDWRSVASLMVRWPDGEMQELGRLRLGAGRYTVVRTE